MKLSNEVNEIAAALSKAQGQIKNAIMDSQNPHLKNKYANLASVTEAIKEALAKNDIAYVQNPLIDKPDGLVGCNVVLFHKSGQWIEFDPLWCKPARGLGPQDVGASMTYLRRYTLSSAVGVTQGAEADDDGETASGRPPKQRQAPQLNDRVQNMLARLAEVNVSREDIEDELNRSVNDFDDYEFGEARKIYEQRRAMIAAKTKQQFEVES